MGMHVIVTGDDKLAPGVDHPVAGGGFDRSGLGDAGDPAAFHHHRAMRRQPAGARVDHGGIVEHDALRAGRRSRAQSEGHAGRMQPEAFDVGHICFL
jgi:hypothetical protein